MSGGFRHACGAVFVIALLALLGCLDIPDEPETGREIEYVSLYILQDGQQDSSLLKIRPGDPATLAAQVFPRQYQKELTHHWIRRTEKDDILLGTEETYALPAHVAIESLPNLLVLKDRVGNSQEFPFSIIVNTPPEISRKTEPANGDMLYGSTNTAVRFKWTSSDSDSEDIGRLTHTLVIDGVQASVGTVSEIMQSGFSEGAHSFRVIVHDSYGDTDTLPEVTFYMVDTLGGLR